MLIRLNALTHSKVRSYNFSAKSKTSLKGLIEDCSIVVYRLIYDLLNLSCLLAFLKQQIMIDKSCRHGYVSRCLVGVKTPSIFLPFFNCPSDIIVMFDFHTFKLFQLNHHPFPAFIILISSFDSVLLITFLTMEKLPKKGMRS